MNQRGIALPMALVTLMVLTSLMVAFSVLATTEPMIGANHMRGAKARSFAEAGVERALWALSHPTETAGLNGDLILPAPATAGDPYAGNTFIGVTPQGGFTVRVSRPLGMPANELRVQAIGWTPTNDPNDPQPKSVKKIETTVMKIKTLDPPCALCVQGELSVTGNAAADARGLSSNGGSFCADTTPSVGTMTSGPTYTGGSGSIYGPDGNNTANESTDKLDNTQADFSFTWTNDELAYLKSMAKANGTYYQGSVTFNSSNKMKDGIIFVDTTTANPFTAATPDSEAGYADIHGGATDTNATGWNGWLIVAGSISISGNIKMNGLVYAQNDLSYRGTGTGQIKGAVLSLNLKDDQATTVDATAGGNADIVYNCQNVRDGGGTISQNWSVKVGTYKEVEGNANSL